jgi:hypothetical protein
VSSASALDWPIGKSCPRLSLRLEIEIKLFSVPKQIGVLARSSQSYQYQVLNLSSGICWACQKVVLQLNTTIQLFRIHIALDIDEGK